MKKLYGVTVAMVTPFTPEGQVDYDAVERLTHFLIEKGVDCLYPGGTTGEMFHLSLEERKKLADTVVRAAAGKVTVFVHCGSMRQDETLELMQHCERIGADGVGVVTPAFHAVSDSEMEEYYVALASQVGKGFPIYLYNIPQCSANDLKTEVADRIARRCPNVVGIKYSFADINRTTDYLDVNDGKFSVLHGCDRAFAAMLALGCDGTVSGISGVFPEPFVEVYAAYRQGDMARAQKMQKVCVRLCDALRSGVNMSYFKEALKLRGVLPDAEMREPQRNISPEQRKAFLEEITQICNDAGIPISV